ncbi:MAG: hypothetical protein KTR14_09745 [Vampirovibrio sp.]|nr:hypothetical protein [Vampirovibrio sp.]
MRHLSSGKRQRRKGDWIRQENQRLIRDELDHLARGLCSPEELLLQENRQLNFLRKGYEKVRVFPPWQRYRWQAKKITKLYHAFPVFKRIPLPITRLVAEILYQ